MNSDRIQLLVGPVFSGSKPDLLGAGCFAPKAWLLARPSRYFHSRAG
jgi:hypothetical protein